MSRKPYLIFMVGFMAAAVLSVALVSLAVFAATRMDRAQTVAQPQPLPVGKLRALSRDPPEAPPEPAPEAPNTLGLSLGLCWFAPDVTDLGETCKATFTLCQPNAPTSCTQWLWVSCRDHYIFIGPHTPTFASQSLFIGGLPFATYNNPVILEVYFANGSTTEGAFALLNYVNGVNSLGLNRFGACLVIAGPSGLDPRLPQTNIPGN